MSCGWARSGLESFKHPQTQRKGKTALSPPDTRGHGRSSLCGSLDGSVGGWVSAGLGRLQRRGDTAHLVAEEAGEAALGGGGARWRGVGKSAHVPEAQRAIVRGGV